MLESKNIQSPMSDEAIAPASRERKDSLRPVRRTLAEGGVEQPKEASLQEKDDETLITIIQNGDESTFRILVERYQERVRNLIYSVFHESEIVDDLSQEVFIKVYEALPLFRFESSFYTWLYRIAINKSRDELRKRKIRRFLSLQVILESPDAEIKHNMVSTQHDAEAQELVAKGLQMIPEKFRIPIILKDINGFTYEEMSKMMECELGTVKSRLSRARTMLRDVLRPLMEEK